MSLYIASLNSGSNANCYYIGNGHEALLVDAGLSCRETERRMKQLGLAMEKVKALFISHEHADHISGMTGISKKYRLPLYITDGTLKHTGMPVDASLVRSFKHGKAISIGELFVLPFRKSHDAEDPHSFMVSGGAVNIGIITDIGYACKRVIKYFSQCHAVFLESNYCEDMLEKGSYPYHLKKRIRSDEGHLSNAQALELFLHYKSPALQLLILSHLSKNNNKPELVKKLFAPHAGNVKLLIASRHEATKVFEIRGKGVISRKGAKKAQRRKGEGQLSLF
ncbi:MAG: MBL fold metallo-hydrolase [Bacteroidota bacterium]